MKGWQLYLMHASFNKHMRQHGKDITKVEADEDPFLLGGGKLACAGGGGGSLEPLSRTPPLLGSRDGALKKVIDGGK